MIRVQYIIFLKTDKFHFNFKDYNGFRGGAKGRMDN